LTYIFAVLLGSVFAIALWVVMLFINKSLPKSFHIRFDHLLIWLISCVLLLSAKKILYKNASLTGLLGLNYFVMLFIGSLLIASVVWLLRRHTEKIVNSINSRITPLVWLFVCLLIFAVPFSFLDFKSHGTDSRDNHKDLTSSQKQGSTDFLENRPNIILVVMDALTAQDMELYGYERHTSPFITEWAKKSIIFNRVYSSSNWTTPSTMSIMTGQRPWTHKIWYRAYFNPVDNYRNNMARVLRDHGYTVYGFVQNPYAHPEVLGIDDAFSIEDKSYSFSLRPQSLNGKIRRYFASRPVVADWILKVQPVFNALINHFRFQFKTTLVPPEIVYDRFLEQISLRNKENKKPGKPFFAWLHVYPPHTWYLPPKPYMGMFGDGGKYDSDIKQEKITYGEYRPGMQGQIDILRKRYDEFIRYSDKQFEKFMSRLSDIADMSNTIIILTSDHGESFSHGYQEHDGPHLYEQLVHVPLIVNIPGRERAARINTIVEQIDIAPTVLELAKISSPEWMEGRSLVSFFSGKSVDSEPVFSMQLIENRSFGNPIEKGTVAVWYENYKLIYYLDDNKRFLFNLKADPDELKNLAQVKTEPTRKLMHLIDIGLASANRKITQSVH
jgi:arylsulfatase A-like enzyme